MVTEMQVGQIECDRLDIAMANKQKFHGLGDHEYRRDFSPAMHLRLGICLR